MRSTIGYIVVLLCLSVCVCARARVECVCVCVCDGLCVFKCDVCMFVYCVCARACVRVGLCVTFARARVCACAGVLAGVRACMRCTIRYTHTSQNLKTKLTTL